MFWLHRHGQVYVGGPAAVHEGEVEGYDGGPGVWDDGVPGHW